MCTGRIYSRLAGTTTSVDFTLNWGFEDPFGGLDVKSAKSSASFSESAMTARTVEVFPNPMPSARMPPSTSSGGVDRLDPVIL